MTESRLDLRCDIAFRVVQSEVFHDECKVDVQHVCEEHIKVPVVHHEHLLAPPPSYLPPPSPSYRAADLGQHYTTPFAASGTRPRPRRKIEDTQDSEDSEDGELVPEVIFPQLEPQHVTQLGAPLLAKLGAKLEAPLVAPLGAPLGAPLLQINKQQKLSNLVKERLQSSYDAFSI